MPVQLGGTVGVVVQGTSFTGVNTVKAFPNTTHNTSTNTLIIRPTTSVIGTFPVPIENQIFIFVIGGGGYGGGNEYAGGGSGSGLVVHRFNQGLNATISAVGAANGGTSTAVVSGTTLTATGGTYAGAWSVAQGGTGSGGNVANLKGGNSGGSGNGQPGNSVTVSGVTYQAPGGGGGFANWGNTAPQGGVGNYTSSFTGNGGQAWSQNGNLSTTPGTNYGGGGGGGGNYGRTGSNGAPGAVVVSYASNRQLYNGGNVSYVYDFATQKVNFVHIFTSTGTLSYIP